MEEKRQQKVNTLPLIVQVRAMEAFQAEDDEDFERAAELAEEILRKEPSLIEIEKLLMRARYGTGDLEGALSLSRSLTERLRTYSSDDEPYFYEGLILHTQGKFREAARILGSFDLENSYASEYVTYYVTTYGDCLEKIGQYEKARDVFGIAMRAYEQSGQTDSEFMLDGIFQRLLYLDVVIGNGCFGRDVEVYKKFLEQGELDERRQGLLQGTIVQFSTLLDRQIFREDFISFVRYVDAKKYLQSQEGYDVIRSAYTSWESYLFHDDKNVSAFVEAYLTASSMDAFGDDNKDERITHLTYEWYMTRYYPTHRDEFVYIREHYPENYVLTAKFLAELESEDPAQIADAKEKELMGLMEMPVSQEKMREYLEDGYRRAGKQAKQPKYIADGNVPYKRSVKIMPNDPCPCGSGKKYKKCHGR